MMHCPSGIMSVKHLICSSAAPAPRRSLSSNGMWTIHSQATDVACNHDAKLKLIFETMRAQMSAN